LMRSLFVGLGLLVLSSSGAMAQQYKPPQKTPPKAEQKKLYRHVDADGKVVFSDRPATADQKAIQQKGVNVASPEATRQLKQQLNDRQREEQAERDAQRQRHYAQQRREAEAERERRAKEADPNSPIQDQARPRVRHY
jgi:hypothetical protein